MGLYCCFKRFFPWIDFFLALHTTRLFKPRRATQSRHSERERGGWTTDRSRAGRATCDQCSKTSLSLSLSVCHLLSLCAWGYTTLQCLNREITILLLWLLWINVIRVEYIRCKCYHLNSFSVRFMCAEVWGIRKFLIEMDLNIPTCYYLRKLVSRGVPTFRDLRDWVNRRRVELIYLNLGKTA